MQESIELPVLIMIAAAFGIAEGMVESGAATILAKGLMGLAGTSLVCTAIIHVKNKYRRANESCQFRKDVSIYVSLVERNDLIKQLQPT